MHGKPPVFFALLIHATIARSTAERVEREQQVEREERMERGS